GDGSVLRPGDGHLGLPDRAGPAAAAGGARSARRRALSPRPWERVLARRGYALVDGGLATELERRGRDLGTALWSAAVLTDDPAAISAVHDDYLEAGADIVIS